MNLADTVFLKLRQQRMDEKNANANQAAAITNQSVGEILALRDYERKRHEEDAGRRGAIEALRGQDATYQYDDPMLQRRTDYERESSKQKIGIDKSSLEARRNALALKEDEQRQRRKKLDADIEFGRQRESRLSERDRREAEEFERIFGQRQQLSRERGQTARDVARIGVGRAEAKSSADENLWHKQQTGKVLNDMMKELTEVAKTMIGKADQPLGARIRTVLESESADTIRRSTIAQLTNLGYTQEEAEAKIQQIATELPGYVGQSQGQQGGQQPGGGILGQGARQRIRGE